MPHPSDSASSTGFIPVTRHLDGPDEEGFRGIWFEGTGYQTSFGKLRFRGEGENLARVRVMPGVERANRGGSVHGGFLLAFLDQALFVGPIALDRLPFGSAVTLNISTQFITAGVVDRVVDCLIEIAGETRAMMFLSGRMEQEGETLLTFQATLRKRPPGPTIALEGAG